MESFGPVGLHFKHVHDFLSLSMPSAAPSLSWALALAILQVFCSVSHQQPHTIEALISFLHLSASTALCSLGHLQRCALTQALLLSWPWHLLIEWHWKVATRPNIHADAPDSLLLNPADSPLVLFEILSDLPSFSLFSVLMLAMPLSAMHYS